jgi:hypothetical protein
VSPNTALVGDKLKNRQAEPANGSIYLLNFKGAHCNKWESDRFLLPAQRKIGWGAPSTEKRIQESADIGAVIAG